MAISNIRTAAANNASGTYSITHGLTISSGDVIVACVHVDLNANSITDNNGSYPFTEAYEGGTTDASTYAIYYRVAGSSEPSSYSWTVSSNAANSIILLVAAGVDTSTIWDVAPSSTRGTGNSNSIVTNDMTVATDGALGLVSGFVDSSNDAIFSSVNNSYGDGVTRYGSRDQVLYRRASMSPGAAGQTTISLSVTDNWAGHQYALKPASAEPTLTCTLSGVRHAYTYSIADETRTQVVHPADWLAVHSVAAGTALNGLAPVGAVVPFAGLIANIPSGWKLCNGDSLLRAGTYADLYTAIGTTYGYADGTHFNLPDCRDKFIVGANQDDASLPKASITGGLTQSYAPATASLTHSMTVADHTLAHAGLAIADHEMTHSVQIADHPSLQLAGTIADQATAGRVGTKTASLAVTASAHAVTWPSIAAQVHTITQPNHTVTHGITQPDAHTGGAVTHGFTVPSAHTMPVPVPAFLAVAYIIRYA